MNTTNRFIFNISWSVSLFFQRCNLSFNLAKFSLVFEFKDVSLVAKQA